MKYHIIILLIAVIFIVNCGEDKFNKDFDALGNHRIYIINNLAETISIIDTETLLIQNHLVNTDRSPNDLKIYKDNLYVVNSLSNNMQIFEPAELSNERKIYFGKSQNPWEIGFYGDYGYVTQFTGDALSVVNLTTDEMFKTIDISVDITNPKPEGIVVSNGKIYISCVNYNFETYSFGGGYVAIYDEGDYSFQKSIEVGTNPQNLIPLDNGEVHVVSTGINENDDGCINVIDCMSDTITATISIGGSPSRFTVDYDNKVVYLAGIINVMSYNYETRDVVNNTEFPLYTTNTSLESQTSFVSDVAFDKERNRLYICEFSQDKILVWDFAQQKIVEMITAGDGCNIIEYYSLQEQ